MQVYILKFLNGIKDIFETATPSVFAALAAILPYFSPIPIAVYTAEKARIYLNFDPWVAGIFVFVLEGLGVWATTTLVDAFVDFIRSRNGKTIFMVIFLSAVVGAYLFILVNLNVRLEAALGEISNELASIITLICFLPALSGVMNGIWKLRLEHKTEIEKVRDLEELHYQQNREERNERWRLRHGFALDVQDSVNYTNYTNITQPTAVKRWDIRKDKDELYKDKEFITTANIEDVQGKYGISRKTVYNWREELGVD